MEDTQERREGKEREVISEANISSSTRMAWLVLLVLLQNCGSQREKQQNHYTRRGGGAYVIWRRDYPRWQERKEQTVNAPENSYILLKLRGEAASQHLVCTNSNPRSGARCFCTCLGAAVEQQNPGCFSNQIKHGYGVSF